MFERILVAFDGTPQSREACDAALEVAARFGSSLMIATVHPPSKEPTDGHLESLVPVDAEGKSLAMLVEELQRDALARGVPSFDHVFLQGEVVPSLVGYLREHPQDLLVTGSRGLSRGRRLLLGSVSSGLVAEAPCPVLVVRPRAASRPSTAHGTTSRPAGRRPT
jgi:nucleotide-binding universal stress UspA family protein